MEDGSQIVLGLTEKGEKKQKGEWLEMWGKEPGETMKEGDMERVETVRPYRKWEHTGKEMERSLAEEELENLQDCSRQTVSELEQQHYLHFREVDGVDIHFSQNQDLIMVRDEGWKGRVKGQK